MFHQRPGKPAFQAALQGDGVRAALTRVNPSGQSGLRLRRLFVHGRCRGLAGTDTWKECMLLDGARSVLVSTILTSPFARFIEPLNFFTWTE